MFVLLYVFVNHVILWRDNLHLADTFHVHTAISNKMYDILERLLFSLKLNKIRLEHSTVEY